MAPEIPADFSTSWEGSGESRAEIGLFHVAKVGLRALGKQGSSKTESSEPYIQYRV